MPTSIPPRASIVRANGSTLVRTVLGLTIYTDDGPMWARDGAAALYEMFLERVHPERPRWFRTSRQDRWRRVTPDLLPALGEHLRADAIDGGLRHQWEVELVDETSAPGVAFRYRESDTTRSPGYAQVLFPHRTSPDELLSLAIEAGQRLPMIGAVGGYTASFTRVHRKKAFRDLHRLCKRYLALDIQEPELFARRVRAGLPSVSWLTLLGPELASRVALEPIRTEPGLTVMPLARATLVRAGRPVLGDVNVMEWPETLALTTAHLAPICARGLPPFDGFGTEEWGNETEAWRARLLEPEGWA